MSALRVRTVLRHARGCWRFVGSGWVVCTRGNIFTRCAWRQPGVTAVRSADQPRVRSFVFNTARAHHSRAPSRQKGHSHTGRSGGVRRKTEWAQLSAHTFLLGPASTIARIMFRSRAAALLNAASARCQLPGVRAPSHAASPRMSASPRTRSWWTRLVDALGGRSLCSRSSLCSTSRGRAAYIKLMQSTSCSKRKRPSPCRSDTTSKLLRLPLPCPTRRSLPLRYTIADRRARCHSSAWPHTSGLNGAHACARRQPWRRGPSGWPSPA